MRVADLFLAEALSEVSGAAASGYVPDSRLLISESTATAAPRTRLAQAEHLHRTTEDVLARAAADGEPSAATIGPSMRRMAGRELAAARSEARAAVAARGRRRLREQEREDRFAELAEFIDLDEPSHAEPRDGGSASAVIAFQRRHGLRADGRVGPVTATALRGDVAQAKAMHRELHPEPNPIVE